jgi:hypothetical protein
MSDKCPYKDYPKKLLLYFIERHPHFKEKKTIKNKSKEELIEIVVVNDISIVWDRKAYELSTNKHIEKLFKELISNSKDEKLSKIKTKDKFEMINILLNYNTKQEEMINNIQNCLRKQENIEMSVDEIVQML